MMQRVYIPDGYYWKEVPFEESPIQLNGIEPMMKEQTNRGLFTGFYNVSIIGLRTEREGYKVSDVFQDWIVMTWVKKFRSDSMVEGGKCREWYVMPATTLAGAKYHKTPMNRLGTAQMPLGYQKGIWRVGKHKGKNALTQTGNQVKVIRDNDGNDTHDFRGAVHTGWYGINLHTANVAGTSTIVGGWSAGCQVTNISQSAMTKLINKLKYCEKRTSNKTYSYFLLEWTYENPK